MGVLIFHEHNKRWYLLIPNPLIGKTSSCFDYTDVLVNRGEGVNLISEWGQLLAAKKTKNVSGERDNS